MRYVRVAWRRRKEFALPPLRRYPQRRLRLVWVREDDPKPLTRGQKQYRRMRERMAVDPEYRERKLRNSRAATKRHYERNRERLAAERRARDREHYAKNRDAINADRRRAYAADGAKIRARNNAWYANNREKRKVYSREYRLRNGERLRSEARDKARRTYAENPRAHLDYYKAWRRANLERARAYVRASGHKRRGAVGEFSFQEWLDLVEEFGGRCGYCGSDDHIEADHRTPLNRGGSNTIDNIIPACRRCNRRKHTMTETEFRALLAREARLREEATGSQSHQDEAEAAG